MQSMAPEYPIIKAEKVEPEVYRVINAILETEQSDIAVAQAYFCGKPNLLMMRTGLNMLGCHSAEAFVGFLGN